MATPHTGVEFPAEEVASPAPPDDVTDDELPQCKIKRNYSCTLCNFFSQNPRSFLYHMRDVHFDKIKIYECSQCLYASKHSQKLQRHINMIHVAGRETAKKAPRRPANTERRPVADVSQPGPSSLVIDVAIEGEEEPKLKCSACSFTSRSPALITRHERVVHLKKRFMRCLKCSYVTHVKARFTKHVKYHSMPMIKCDLCDFRTPYKWNLDRHYKNHCGNGAFQCSKCNFRADIKQSLTVHEMNHHVPPVGAGAAILMRKKNKVGASETTAMEVDDIAQEELELLRLEREDEVDDFENDDEEPDLNAEPPGKLEAALLRPSPQRQQTNGFATPEQSSSHQCRMCSYTATFPHEITRHEKTVHGKDKRPPPNLIPIQSSPVQKTARSKLVNEDEFNEMCRKSSLTKSLKQFVSLIGDEDAFKSIPDTSEEDFEGTEGFDDDCQDSKSIEMNGEGLVCDICGHESKSMTEKILHDGIHEEEKEDLVVSGNELTSTRCKHCRQRCKTSADLLHHLKTCVAFVQAYESREASPSSVETFRNEPNRVFVWNETPKDELGMDAGSDDDDAFDMDDDCPPEFPLEVQLETSEPSSPPPTLPQVLNSLPPERSPSSAAILQPASLTLKKVFKCPHCNFWASTASRFHVHIVGHLNKKPFECSLCSYRSNWRWDITKHIRLKSARDPNHSTATVNMTDETGRRNYSKYNKYLTMMRVQEPTADSSGTGKRTRPCDATQGTVKDGDILQPLPEPPKLTPAPHQQAPGSSKIRPPPPLHAAHSVGKKTLWKCKKCLYRNSNKDKVLAHVKTHYDKKSPTADGSEQLLLSPTTAGDEDAEEEAMESADETLAPVARKRYKCGHCHRVSDWQQVIHRHCLLIHDGDMMILPCSDQDTNQPSLDTPEALSNADIPTDGDSSQTAAPQKPPPTSADLRGPFACETCPFTAKAAGDLTAHKLNHVDRPGSIFKCTFCPFYVPSKIAVLEHMEIHGIDRYGYFSLKVDNLDEKRDIYNCPELKEGSTEEMKRFQCSECPYISNSKTQFLYHKQFHRPRSAPYKCNYCSYNVTRRHLLHQHLRVHHSYRTGSEEDDIPLVWVLRGGTYHKMYKCRWCPHVNSRKANIQEHEKMHMDKFHLKCPQCSYTCNNPGVLSTHHKVHSGVFGKIKSLVDPRKSDEEQIQSLQKSEKEEQVVSVQSEPIEETPESSYYQSNTALYDERTEPDGRSVNFCGKCPARFFFKKELRIHSRFHLIRLPFKCSYCSYTARQRPHLLAHYKVHSQEYQNRTEDLVHTHRIWPEHPRPNTAVVNDSSEDFPGPVWSVVASDFQPETSKEKKSRRHSCHLCPAKFFKQVALQYHLTLHGGSHQHKCKFCDYSVKTYGNLIKHQLVHQTGGDEKPPTPQERPSTPEKKPDPQFGLFMHGSPDFIYPMYLKNGKLKEKRYKCHKCPSAFEKRDQYRVHLSLHGSKQKYKCEKCDYSVKYYANYIQHMKKHKHNEEAHQQEKEEIPKPEPEEEPGVLEESKPVVPELTQTEKQTMQEKRRKSTKEEDRKMLNCELCPYMNLRKDCLENHERRHYILSGVKYGFDCEHCDYSTTQPNFLREHSRVHFKPLQLPTPEAYMLVQGLTILSEVEPDKFETVFKENEDGTYEPPLDQEYDEAEVEVKPKFVDLASGDIVEENPPSATEPKAEDLMDDLIEMVEVAQPEKPKRLRGKNWKCKKCPHAFGKRDQYLRHISLHGSEQRYSCDMCDYSVKFYTNYVQHMRMHQTHEPERQIDIKQYVAGMDAKSPARQEDELLEELDADAEDSESNGSDAQLG